MPMQKPLRTAQRLAARVSLAAAMIAAAPSVYALGNDSIMLRAFARTTYDSNVFRISDDLDPDIVLGGRSKSDQIWGVGAGIRCDLPISQQRVLLDASATRYDYSRFDQLDYTAYALRAAWDWRLGKSWSGRIGGGRREDRQTYSADVGFFIPSLLTTSDVQLDARYALGTRWELQAQLTAFRYRYDNDQQQVDDFDSDSLSMGVRYKTALGNALGLRLLHQQGQWPNRSQVQSFLFDDEYRQYTLSVVADWRPSSRSRLYGDLGYTWRDQGGAEDRDFDGMSGQITYDYALGGKSQLRASVYQLRGPIEDFTATYTRSTGLSVTYFYELGPKTRLQANAGYRELSYAGLLLAPDALQRDDELSTFGASVAYQAMRKLTLNAGARYDQRRSNAALGDYSAHTLFLNANVEF